MFLDLEIFRNSEDKNDYVFQVSKSYEVHLDFKRCT